MSTTSTVAPSRAMKATACAAEQLLPQIVAHRLASMDGVLDRQGPIWDMIRRHPLYDAGTTDFLDPLALSDQAVFVDGSVLEWTCVDGWLSRKGEHSPFPHTHLIRHDGERWHWLERATQEDGARGDWRDVTPVNSSGAHGGRYGDA